MRFNMTIRMIGLLVVGSFLISSGTADVGAQTPPDITVEVIEVDVGPSNSNPSNPIVWNNELYFSADDGFECSGNLPGQVTGDELGEWGRELFTAGINTGPVLVKEINTWTSGNCNGVSALLHDSAAGMNSALVFTARAIPSGSNSKGFEPWRSEGTEETTEIVRDILLGPNSSSPSGQAAVLDGSRVAFSAGNTSSGTEPYISDGTQAGTQLIADIAAGSNSFPHSFTPLDATRFVFVATDDDVLGEELYVSTGASATLVADINSAPYDHSDIRFLTALQGQGKVVFIAYDETAGREPWVSDGTPAGTFRLADINPGIGSSNTYTEQGNSKVFTQVGDLMFFTADDGDVGGQLWATDGTTAGTYLVSDFTSGSGGGFYGNAAEFQGLLFFGAPGIGLWTSDGTELGTGPLVEGIFPSALRELTAVGDHLFFASEEDLWVSDGTAAGTVSVQTFPNGNVPRALTAVGTTMLAFVSTTADSGVEMFLAYDTSLGPDLTGPAIAIGFAPIPIGEFEDGTLTATANETNTGGANIANIEFQLDSGSWMPMEAADGAYDSILESGIQTISFATAGLHEACVRATDSLGNLGDVLCMDIPVGDGDLMSPPPPTVDVDPDPVLVDEPTTVSIVASDATTGNSEILIIEYNTDGGNWISILTPVDGFYDEPTEEGEVELVFDSTGLHTVCARAADDANNVGDPTCVDVQVDAPEPTLRLRAIEVNQVIQSWRNEVRLYRGKQTVVRVFLERFPGGPSLAKGVLHGSIGGLPLPGSPLPPDRGRASQLAEDATVVDDPTTAGVNESWRAHLENSLQYTLPGDWISQTGPLDLEFSVTDPPDMVLACEEPDGTSDCTVSVSFEQAESPVIEFFSVPYDRNHQFQLDITATAGTYTLTSDGRESDPIPFDAPEEDVEDAVRDVLGGTLNANDGRVSVFCGNPCTANSRRYTITVLRGQAEELLIDDSGLGAGTGVINSTQVGGPETAPTHDHLREQVWRILDMFPTHSVDYRFRDLAAYGRAPRLGKVNMKLTRIGLADKALGNFRPGIKSFGYMLQFGPGSKAGYAGARVSSTYSGTAEVREASGYRRSTAVHEAAHTWGRGHAVFMPHPSPVSPLAVGLCGSTFADLFSSYHPFIEFTGIEHELEHNIDQFWSEFWPTIGPLSEPDAEIWGFSPRAYAGGSALEHLVVVDPRLSAELMSYCNVPNNQGRRQKRWPSSFTYDILHNRIGNSDSKANPHLAGGGEGDFMIVAGFIDDATGEVEMDPTIRVTGTDPGNEPGDVHVALVDGLGTEIAAADVALLVDGDHGSLSDGVGPEPQYFVASVEIPAGMTPAGVVVSLDGGAIAHVNGSANPPTVALTSPVGGSTVSGSIPIAWTPGDVDGDSLSTTILYSIDSGLTWETLAVDLEATEYDAPARYLKGSGQAQIRVLVSDGFHTAEATSSVFSVDAGYPLVSIESPTTDLEIVAGGTLHLVGSGWDPEDGVLDGGHLWWTSDVDGLLGPGTNLSVFAFEMTAGCHVITLTGTDSHGHSDTQDIQVDVGATGCLGLVFSDGFESGNVSAWGTGSP